MSERYQILYCPWNNKRASSFEDFTPFWKECSLWHITRDEKGFKNCRRCKHGVFCGADTKKELGTYEKCTECRLKFYCWTLT